MQIGPDGVFHLTYGTKIHPGRGWEELLGNLRACVPPLKARLAPQQPFGLGLRLSNAESAELLGGDNLPQFQAFLAQNGLYRRLYEMQFAKEEEKEQPTGATLAAGGSPAAR